MSRRTNSMDIRAILMHIQAGCSNRQIERDLDIDRRTVQRYREWAEEYSILGSGLPCVETLQGLLEATIPGSQPPQNISTVETYRKLVEELVKQNVEARAIHERLRERGFEGSCSAVYRFVRKARGQATDATVRVERPPGEEAQVDFGYGGMMIDPVSGKKRRAWALVMTLSWSRPQYVEFVFDQKVETWLRCHRNAFCFFEGNPIPRLGELSSSGFDSGFEPLGRTRLFETRFCGMPRVVGLRFEGERMNKTLLENGSNASCIAPDTRTAAVWRASTRLPATPHPLAAAP